MTEIDRAQLAALDASGMHNTGRMQFEYGDFDTVKTETTTGASKFDIERSEARLAYKQRAAERAAIITKSAQFPSASLIASISEDEWNNWDASDENCVAGKPLNTQIGGSHYKDMAIQPLDYIMKNGLGFAEGNVVKYVTRWRVKGGVEDLRKARHYLDVLIEGEGEK